MWMFWTVAGLLAAAAAALIMGRAAGAARRAAARTADPTLELYHRQLAEIDDLAARGLLGEAERSSARAEAARRLLSAADDRAPAEAPGGRGSRLAVALGGAAAALAALGLYIALGSPGTPDQPYRARVAAWRAADPAALDAPRMAAVLRTIAAEHPSDPQAFDFLGRAELAAGDPFAAERAFGRAIQLGGRSPDLYASLGQARVMQADGKVTPEAKAAFQQALALDPNNVSAGYAIGRAALDAGDPKAAAAAWRALAQRLPAADPRRGVLLAEAEHAVPPAGLPVLSGPETAAGAAIRQAAPAEQAAFIRGMVERLAARLQAQPDDPDGWARLVRAYGVIGDKAAQARALATARKQFAGRPDALAKIEAEARATGAG